MVTLAGYENLIQIHESDNSLVYRARRTENNQPVILKFLNQEYPTVEQIRRYKQEYHLTCQLDSDGIVKAYSLEEWQRSFVIVLEDFGGISLKEWFKKREKLSLEEFLFLAIATVESLGQIHGVNIIHKDINPANIVFNPETQEVKIIDFGIASQLSRENPTLKNPNVLEGTLAYISPEQTGRMNRSLDYRTDFYSLGVTFYEMLAGKLPFESADTLELVHCHLAQNPPLIMGEIPQVIADIVMKLMAKNAEERYQSAMGLKADLEECRRQLEETGNIAPFSLGKKDIYERFSIPQKLYGREGEIGTLLAAFERVAETGKVELMMVAGYSGIGKSSLVQELYKPITARRGYFISGKFDQFQRNIPYSAVVAAFSDLVRQLLTETELQLQQWRAKIEEAVGTNGRLIIDAIPEVELIIGPQPEVLELGPTESQNRFNLVFDKFVRTFCDRSHPLVIFLDDLQWADSATLKLIELMMGESDTQYLLLIGAYRNNEVDSVHPLTLTLEKLRDRQATVEQITLKPLSSSHINQLIADTLQSDRSLARSLAELVEEKTGGNPFFVNQFLTTLHEEQLVRFETKEKSWQWDLSKIKAMGLSDNVVELMVGKLQKLPQTTQQILSEAACIGAEFSLSLIGALHQESDRSELYQLLLPGVQSGLIFPTSTLDADLSIEEYRFLHDRVQQAAYSTLPESEKPRVHYLLGRMLWDRSTPEELEELLFEVAAHLNAGIELATSPGEREEIAQLNLRVGQKAKAATAYTAAANYLETGRDILASSGWKSQYQLMLDLHLEGIEVAYLGGDYATMHSLFEVLDDRAKEVLERVKAYEILINFYAAQNQMSVAISTGLQVLSMLGIDVVESPPAYRDPAELYDRETMKDKKQLAALKILANLFGAAYISDQEFLTRTIWTMYKICLLHGNSPLAANSYAFSGFLLCATEEIELGYEYGKLGLKLVEKFNAKAIMGKVKHSYHVFIQPYKEALRSGIKDLIEMMESCVEQGDLEFGSYTSTDLCINIFLSGTPLETVLKQQKYNIIYAQKTTKQEYAFIHNRIWAQLTENLMGESSNNTELVGSYIDERELLPIIEEKNNTTNLCRLYLVKAILSYTLKDFSAGLTQLQRARTYESAVRGTICVSALDFYHSLFLLALYSSSDRNSAGEYLKQVTLNQEKIKVLAKHAPMNFQHKYDLVEAEKARVLGEVALAMQFYEGAISGAKENLYLQEEALAYELAAEFYLSLGMVRFARLYMKEAHYCYTRWGAAAKVEDLSQRYPQLLTQTAIANKDNLTDIVRKTSTGKTVSKVLDLETVMQANQAISGKIMLDELLAQLMKIAIYNAGAQAGFLILDSEGQLLIQASGEMDNDKITVLQSLPMSDRLSEGIVNYVARTRETVVLNDACKEGNFINDPYITGHQTKSVLCSPLVDGGKLVGIVYLENNLTTGAFTTDRLEMLQLLSGQAAIAIANARLYSQLEDYSRTLEQKVEERTAQLAEATREAKAASEAKSAFLTNMSHELRTPLNAILGFSQLLIRNSHLPPREQENVGIIARSGEHLLTLINQVLDLSKIEAGRITLNSKNFDLYRLLDDIEDLLGLKASEKGLQLTCDRDEKTPRYINTDEMKLRQVLINLINNAIKFTAVGGVEVRVRQKTDNSPKVELEFEVTDTGAGIAYEEIDSLFEAFVQTATGKESQEGTGLGLPISRKFVQLMGGDILVTSEVGRGTTFTFNIQATTAEEADVESKKPTRRAVALAPNQRRYRLLVVDDKPINCQLLIKLLMPFGFDIKEASNGREAVDIYTEWQPDLIFMDMRMPVMDGYEATRQIKAAAGSKPCAVVAVTASVLEEEKAVVLEAGCDDFIRKPFKDGEIIEAIARHLGAEFIYERLGEADRDREEALTARGLAAVSQELLTALEEGLLTLEPEEIQEAIDAIASYVPVVARQLESLVNSFAYQEILDLIEESKELIIDN